MKSHIRKIRNYKDLKFWKTSFKVSIMVIRLSSRLPKNYATYIIKKQIIRSAVSVGANIAEGFGRYKGKEYPRFLQIALGSANETEYWLMIVKEIFPKFSDEIEQIIDLNNQTIRMLASSLKTLRKKY